MDKRVKKLVIIGITLIVLVVLAATFFRLRPLAMSKQDRIQEALSCALKLYEQAKESMELSSQCLGVCGDYAVDIVHVPRAPEDDLPENQCEAYRKGEVQHFIELDKYGNLVRVV